MDTELDNRLQEIRTLVAISAKNVLSVNEVALLTGRSPKTIYNRIREIPHYNGPFGIKFLRSEVEQWMCRTECPPTHRSPIKSTHKQ